MGNGSVAGAIIMAICCFGCALTFLGIGVWASKSNKPVHFWAGTDVPVEKVTDVLAYNRANALMWKIYSIPYWLSGAVGSLGFFGDIFTIASAILLFLACFPGIFLLVRRYRKIEEQFFRR